jgi:hypothetical protein
VGFHDFPLQFYHAEWTGVSSKNIAAKKSFIGPTNNRIEVDEELAYRSDLNSITGGLNVTGDTRINGDFTVGSAGVTNKQVHIYSDTQISNNLTV